jgi:lipopolysaccharide export system permease protein
MRLHRYLARRYLFSFLAVLATFLLILSLFDLLEQIRRYGDRGIGFGNMLALTFLNVPRSLYRILPLITIIASIFLFLALARSSELVVSRAAGQSVAGTLVGPVLVSFATGVVAVAVFNPIVAVTMNRYEAIVEDFSRGQGNVLSITREGLWLRQAEEDGQSVIRAARASLDGTRLEGATFLAFDGEGRPVARVEAREAQLVPGAWEVTDAKRWALDAENPELTATQHARLVLPSTLTADEILDSFGDPAAIPIWDLPAFIERLEAAGFSARMHRVFYHAELSLPLLMAAMTLIGAGFTMRHTRLGRTGVLVLMALGSGFALYFVRDLAEILGQNGQIPVLLSVWAPAVAAVLLPVALILHLEDG